MSETRPLNVLFLCTGNSARSVMSEALLMRWGNERFNAFSAGSQPKGKIHPKTVETLETNNFNTSEFRSKSWDEFSKTNSPTMDIVITVCSNAANESCPVFPGAPISIHWDIDDPARDFDTEEEQNDEFKKIFNEIEERIKNFTHLTLEKMNKPTQQENLSKFSDPK